MLKKTSNFSRSQTGDKTKKIFLYLITELKNLPFFLMLFMHRTLSTLVILSCVYDPIICRLCVRYEPCNGLN